LIYSRNTATNNRPVLRHCVFLLIKSQILHQPPSNIHMAKNSPQLRRNHEGAEQVMRVADLQASSASTGQ